MTIGKTQKIVAMSINGRFMMRTRFGLMKPIKAAKIRFLFHGKLVSVKAIKHRFKTKAAKKCRFAKNPGRGMTQPAFYYYDDLPVNTRIRFSESMTMSRSLVNGLHLGRFASKIEGLKHRFIKHPAKKRRFTK